MNAHLRPTHLDLLKYGHDNKLNQFEEAIKNGADANFSENNKLSAFESALCGKWKYSFLRSCLDMGCKKDYVNKITKKSAIHYAVESQRSSILLELLCYNETENINVNYCHESLTPLNYLAKVCSPLNVHEIIECMILLRIIGATIDTQDEGGLSPLDYILRNNEIPPKYKYELECILRPDLKRNIPPPLSVNPKTENSTISLSVSDERSISEMIRHRLSRQNGFTSKMKYLFGLIKYNARNNENNETTTNNLLQTLSSNTDAENLSILITSATENLKLFKIILNSSDLSLSPLASTSLVETLIKDLTLMAMNKEVLSILFKSKHVDVNRPNEKGEAPLRIAANACNETAVQLLLRQGAYMGMRSDYKGLLPIERIRPEILEEHLNSCITLIGGRFDRSHINLNMANISHAPHDNSFGHNDMRALSYFKKSEDFQHLLRHPLVTSMLTYKWNQYSNIFYSHFIIFLIFLVCISTYILSKFPKEQIESNSNISLTVSVVGILYLFAREAVQFSLGCFHYIHSACVNILDLLIIILSTLTCSEFGSPDTQRSIAAYTFLFTSCKFAMLLSSIPIEKISKPLLMGMEVMRNVMKSLSVLVIFKFIFSICFHIRFANSIPESTNQTKSLKLSFDSIPSSFMKSIIMSTGEYDASNLEFKNFFDYIMLLLFVIGVGISLFNLLTAMAVSDIQVIRNQAEIFRSINLVNFYNMSEEFLNHRWWTRWKFQTLKNYLYRRDYAVRKITISKTKYPHFMAIYTYATDHTTTTKLKQREFQLEDQTPLIQPKDFSPLSVQTETLDVKINISATKTAKDYVACASSFIRVKSNTCFNFLKNKISSNKYHAISNETFKCCLQLAESNHDKAEKYD